MTESSQGPAGPYKVVLIFHLKPDTADEELRRSREPHSFPSRLARQPGFLGLELVRLAPDRTMSIQSWRSERDWWAALEAAKAAAPSQPAREDILVSRDFFGGVLVGSVP